MKVEDLMIGDIIFRQTQNGWNPVVVTLPLLSDIENYPNLYKPVKLTEKVLTEQGFVKHENGTELTKNIYICNGVVLGESQDKKYSIGICTIEYLHELQHFLKLRKVEKNFEIN